ncbi:MAG: hypothetical protein O3B13_24705, partial [Planctomycetota bacterium]|nr:hypothetical protein [Planctomycetota bacterium]
PPNLPAVTRQPALVSEPAAAPIRKLGQPVRKLGQPVKPAPPTGAQPQPATPQAAAPKTQLDAWDDSDSPATAVPQPVRNIKKKAAAKADWRSQARKLSGD